MPRRHLLREVMPRQYRRCVQPTLSARPTLDIRRREQLLAHRLELGHRNLWRYPHLADGYGADCTQHEFHRAFHLLPVSVLREEVPRAENCPHQLRDVV